MYAELDRAITGYLERASNAGCTGHISSKAHCDHFESRFPAVMPAWYRYILENFPIGDICFTASVAGLSWQGYGHFRDAQTLLSEIDGAFPDERLAKNGCLIIGAAGDGDGWMIRSKSTPDDPVHFLRCTSYGTDDPANSRDCLLKHGASFYEFLGRIEPSKTWG